jgi:PII-like signaling protein
MGTQRKMLSVFIDKADQWREGSLFEAIVYTLERNGVAGATVIDGIMGYGIHRRVHRKGLFGVSDEKPIVVIAVDEEQRLRSVLPKIAAMVKEGLLTLQDVEVVAMGGKLSSEELKP